MKKVSLAVSAIIMAAAITGCGSPDKGSGTGHMYNAVLLGNPQSLDPQFAEDTASNTVIKNLYSGLMSVDDNGNISCCNAENYTVSDDGTVYTFTLRDDNYWYFDENDDDVITEDEYFPVTADDYVFAMRRVLDPRMKSPYANDFSCIKDARLILSGLIEPEEAEIYAVDKKTLVVVLENPDTEFLYLMSTPAAYPCNKEFFDSTKGRYGLDDRSVMSNGAFFVRQWFYDPYGSNNILYMKRNDADWSETYDIAPSYLSFSIEKNEDDIRKRFKDEETECFTSLSKSPYNPKKYSITPTAATTLGLIFNPENKNLSNINLRKAIAYSVEREMLLTGCAFYRTENTASDAQLRIRLEGRIVRRSVLADGTQKSQHSLLGQVLAVPAGKKIGAGTNPDQAAVPAGKDILCPAVAADGFLLELFIAESFIIFHSDYHIAIELY